jgi:hypothetical protein
MNKSDITMLIHFNFWANDRIRLFITNSASYVLGSSPEQAIQILLSSQVQ